jgi:ferric-chelate reductase
MYVFRRYWYEIFLITHIILAIIFLVGCWYHVVLLEGGHMEWLYASIALWSFDRFIRLARMAVLNLSWSENRVARTGKVEIIGTDAIKARINVEYNFGFYPGQYLYVYFPRFNFWESHPFTIAEYEVVNGQPVVTLLFRTHGGVTEKLQKYLANGPKEMYCLLEGPYGHYCPVDKYDNVLLLAGGVGVTAVFPYLQYLANLGVNRVRFVWVVRDEDSMNWFTNAISFLPLKNVDIEIHITKSGSGKVVETAEKRISLARDRISVDMGVKPEEIGAVTNSKEIDGDNNGKGLLARHIFVGSKPCLREVVAGQVLEVGSLAVLACGPDTFVDETRQAVAENITKAKGTVDYFEESFTW